MSEDTDLLIDVCKLPCEDTIAKFIQELKDTGAREQERYYGIFIDQKAQHIQVLLLHDGMVFPDRRRRFMQSMAALIPDGFVGVLLINEAWAYRKPVGGDAGKMAEVEYKSLVAQYGSLSNFPAELRTERLQACLNVISGESCIWFADIDEQGNFGEVSYYPPSPKDVEVGRLQRIFHRDQS